MGDAKSNDKRGVDEARLSGEWELPEEFETGATIQIGDLQSTDEESVEDDATATAADGDSESDDPVHHQRPSIVMEVVAEDGLDEAIKSIIPQVISANEQPEFVDDNDDPQDDPKADD